MQCGKGIGFKAHTCPQHPNLSTAPAGAAQGAAAHPMQTSDGVPQLLLQVPRGFEPEALAEASKILGVTANACLSHTHCGLVLCPCGPQSPEAALVATCGLLSLERAYAYLGSIQLDVQQLQNADLGSRERLAGLIAGAEDAGRQLAWEQALTLWRQCRLAGNKSCDLGAVTFRASSERFEHKAKGLRNQVWSYDKLWCSDRNVRDSVCHCRLHFYWRAWHRIMLGSWAWAQAYTCEIR